MKKLFLTSGLVLCMACPAYAGLQEGDINTTGNSPVLQGASGPTETAPDCTVGTLQATEGPVSLDAVWTANSYAITYDKGSASNSGNPNSPVRTPTGSMSNGSVTYDDDLIPAANGFTAPTGYEFDNYIGNKYDGTSGTQTYVPGTTYNPYNIDGGITLTAQWKPKEYTITYNHGTAGARTNGFTGAMSNETVKYDDAKSLTANTWAIDGYTFTGWKGDYSNATAGGTATPDGTAYTDEYTFSPSYQIDHNLTLTAQWSANSYNIIYECGGTTNPSHSASYNTGTGGVTLNYDSNAKYAEAVTYDGGFTLAAGATVCGLDGYDFVGWDCTNLTGTPTVTEGNSQTATLFAGGATGTYTYANNVTCTAKWAPKAIELHWFKDNTEISVTGTDAASCTYDGSITLAPEQSKTGYTFQGWRVRQ